MLGRRIQKVMDQALQGLQDHSIQFKEDFFFLLENQLLLKDKDLISSIIRSLSGRLMAKVASFLKHHSTQKVIS